MWLTTVFDDSDITNWPVKLQDISVTLCTDKTIPINNDIRSLRVSPIFSLNANDYISSIENTKIYFFNFNNAYKVLGRIEKKGTDELIRSTFFSCGLSSVIIITDDLKVLEEFRQVVTYREDALEEWTIENSRISDLKFSFFKEKSTYINELELVDYDSLPVTERSIIDEFRITIKLLITKLDYHMPSEILKFRRLIAEINGLIVELVYLCSLSGPIPPTLNEYSFDDLKEEKLNHLIRHQAIDRIIQVNSALSYISTQAFSGAIPIFERRSLIRRNSLLGVGAGILALNNIAKFIENAFSVFPFDDAITMFMAIAPPLTGVNNLPQYDSSDWDKGSINVFSYGKHYSSSYFKLPYFSGRLGFRETEYSIAAAIQTISSGASLEWSLMTLTHEMLHGHVRNIITFLFLESESLKPEEQRKKFYNSFNKKLNKKPITEKLIDSVRNIILTYCAFTLTHGSLTAKKPYSSNKFKICIPSEADLWNLFERENRNISEIFVHIMDLHYFYASRVSIYIPMIWCSWTAVPYISGDIRQYILRSILAISSKINGESHDRFNSSIARLSELLLKYRSTKLKSPIINEVLNILDDKDKLMKYYFPAFKASLLIVDLVVKIFISSKVRGALFNDDFVKWENNEKDEDSFEEQFKYELPNGFNDESIKSPISYLVDRMTKELNSTEEIEDLERETTIQFLALNSN